MTRGLNNRQVTPPAVARVGGVNSKSFAAHTSIMRAGGQADIISSMINAISRWFFGFRRGFRDGVNQSAIKRALVLNRGFEEFLKDEWGEKRVEREEWIGANCAGKYKVKPFDRFDLQTGRPIVAFDFELDGDAMAYMLVWS